jgi:exosortase/archaeosortase family protein
MRVQTLPDQTPPPADSPGTGAARGSGAEPGEAGDKRLAWGLVAATVAVFWPVTRWMVEETVARQQIRQAFILLAAAAGLVAWQHRGELRVRGDLCNRTLGLLAGAFGLVGAVAAGAWPLLTLPALALALAGCLQALFGAGGYRFFRPLVAGVAVFSLIIVLFPVLDWPLRQLAGVGSAKVLQALHLAPQLTLAGSSAEPQLVLSVAGGHFLVATECNGFGLITSSALLAILAGGIAGRRWWAITALVPAALVIGFVVNVARILVISTTARYFPEHYNVLHEVAGTLALWGGLGLVGLLAWRPAAASAVASLQAAKR